MTTRLLVLLTVLFFVIHLAFLDYRGLWGDEILTVKALDLPFLELLKDRARAGHSPVYFLGLKAWAHFFGKSTWSLRFPSLVAATIFFLISSLMFRTYLRKQANYLIILLFFHPFVFFLSQEARMYAIACSFMILSTYFLLQHYNEYANNSHRRLLISLLCLAMSTLVQPVMIFAIPAHFIFMCLQSCRIEQKWSLLRNITLISLPSAIALLSTYFAFAFKQVSKWSPHYSNSPRIPELIGKIVAGKLLHRAPFLTLNSYLVTEMLNMVVIVFICICSIRLLTIIHLRKRALVTLSRNHLVIQSGLLACSWIAFVLFLSLNGNRHIEVHRYHGPILVPLLIIVVFIFSMQGRSKIGKLLESTAMLSFASLILIHGISHSLHLGTGYRETAHIIHKLGDGPYRFFVYRDFQFSLSFYFYNVPVVPNKINKLVDIQCSTIRHSLDQYSEPNGHEILFLNLEETKYRAQKVLESTIQCLKAEYPSVEIVESAIVGHRIVLGLKNAKISTALNK